MSRQLRLAGIESSPLIPALFAVTVFFGATLLFLMEPYVGKSLLPLYGGTPAVWNTCVFFFQFMLLAGYVYVYVINRYLSIPAQLLVHGVTITAAAMTLPLRFATIAAAYSSEQPIASLVQALSLSAGLPFLVVSTTAPLVQVWYAKARVNANPYWLYVASNAGSLAALIAYPALVEDWLPLSKQSAYWSYSFFVYAVLLLACGLCALVCRRTQPAALEPLEPAAPLTTNEPRPVATEVVPGLATEGVTYGLRVKWLLWSMCPSSLMLGVTTYLSSEIAPIPVLWVLPLAVYLISFMIAFADPPVWLTRLSETGYILLAVIVAFSGSLLYRADLTGLVFHVALLFLGATAMHSQLASHRPDATHLTEYYLWISVGGLCGGVFNSLLAPVVFKWLAEYPLAIALGLLLIPWPLELSRLGARFQGAFRLIVAALVLLGLSWNVYFSKSSHYVMHRERTFFGSYSIVEGSGGVTHALALGTTNHGIQNYGGTDRRARGTPLSYFFYNSPIGQLFIANRRTDVTQSVGIVGLGIGTLARYGDPGQEFTFYEIDPAVERIARNPRWFTFLDDAEARGVKIRVEIGDARLKLREAPDASFGVLVLDAFTSDAVPTHLLTKEAVSLYLTKLKPGGLLAFQITNIYVDLEPVLSNVAADLGLLAYIQADDKLSAEEARQGKKASTWIIMAPSAKSLEPMLKSGKWRQCQPNPGAALWTDDRSNLLRAMRW